MSMGMKASRTQVWLENLGEWSWPGQGGAAAEALPPSWVPAFPPRLEPAIVGPATSGARRPGRARAHRLITGTLLCALAAVCAALALNGQLTVERLIGVRTAGSPQQVAPAIGSAAPARPLPTFRVVSQDAAGSSIDAASYPSAALHGQGSFLAYLPAGYADTTSHYPVLYLLTGNDQQNTAFLQIGLQAELDRLIARHAIPPLIAVMIQGGPGSNNWRNRGALRYESYILEVQELIDRTLPTVAVRDARAIVGDSMGGYGAMNVALANPYRFGVVESWLSFFNGLGDDLRADRPIFSRLGLHAFIYGGEEDHIANPDEDAPFAAALRASGADAKSAIYPGEHNLETLQAHLASMLTFAGRALSAARPVASVPGRRESADLAHDDAP
jgi:enterochelin esterase-like enzyme